jgi:hypothetical protein
MIFAVSYYASYSGTVIYVLLLLCLCILIVCLCIFIVRAGTLRLPWLSVFRAFTLVVKQMPGYITHKDGARPAFFQNFCVVLYIVRFLSFCILFVCKRVLYYCHRVENPLQLTNISYGLTTDGKLRVDTLFAFFPSWFPEMCHDNLFYLKDWQTSMAELPKQ